MKKMILAASLCVLLVSGFTSAAIFDDDGDALQVILDNATVDGDSSVDTGTDFISDASDSYWEVGATGGSIGSVLFTVPSTAGVAFGIYENTANGPERIELLENADTDGQQVMLSIRANGDIYRNLFENIGNIDDNEFGYYVESWGGICYSDTYLNIDGVDRMVAYQGTDTDRVQIDTLMSGIWGSGEYVLAWESSDTMQYDDFVVMVESVNPTVPEPASMLLLGLGGLILRKRKSSGD